MRLHAFSGILVDDLKRKFKYICLCEIQRMGAFVDRRNSTTKKTRKCESLLEWLNRAYGSERSCEPVEDVIVKRGDCRLRVAARAVAASNSRVETKENIVGERLALGWESTCLDRVRVLVSTELIWLCLSGASAGGNCFETNPSIKNQLQYTQ